MLKSASKTYLFFIKNKMPEFFFGTMVQNLAFDIMVGKKINEAR